MWWREYSTSPTAVAGQTVMSLSCVVVGAIPLSVVEFAAQRIKTSNRCCPRNDVDAQNLAAGDVMTRRNERPRKIMIASKTNHHGTCE